MSSRSLPYAKTYTLQLKIKQILKFLHVKNMNVCMYTCMYICTHFFIYLCIYPAQFKVETMLAKLYKWCNEGASYFQTHDFLLLWVPSNDGITYQAFTSLLGSTKDSTNLIHAN